LIAAFAKCNKLPFWRSPPPLFFWGLTPIEACLERGPDPPVDRKIVAGPFFFLPPGLTFFVFFPPLRRLCSLFLVVGAKLLPNAQWLCSAHPTCHSTPPLYSNFEPSSTSPKGRAMADLFFFVPFFDPFFPFSPPFLVILQPGWRREGAAPGRF